MTRPQRVEIEPGVIRLDATDYALRRLIRERDKAVAEIAVMDAAMLVLRKRYAAERGEFMLPTIERLRREFLG